MRIGWVTVARIRSESAKKGFADMKTTYRSHLLVTTLLMGASALGTPVYAQVAQASSDAPDAVEESQEVVVTGSRIIRPNLSSASPTAVVSGDQTVENADITLETFLNTLPQVNPAGTTTSNNPGNNGQSNIDLRGLGSNRNLVLIDGRRPMVSATTQAVDLNTIPQGLIERIDIVTGGAGAAYGADAIAGVVNMILKDDFQGIDLRANYSNSLPKTDAREFQISGTIGGNFADDKGNLAFSVEYSKRQGLIKAQRRFAEQATSTTGTFPTGRYTSSSSGGFSSDPTSPVFSAQFGAGNPIPQAAINTLFARYGSAAVDYPTQTLLGFNSDGSLFGVGTFNSPRNVTNYRYGPNSPANANLNFFPDFYTYNFDIVNILVLPLERKSAFLKGNYKINDSFDFFVQAGYTDYTSSSALAPTPLGTTIRNPANATALQAGTNLIAAGNACRNSAGAPTLCGVTGMVVPSTNPFIPADLRTLLNARTGDSPTFTGSGANEAFALGYRFLGTGLREQQFDNRVIQGLAGLRGEIAPGWRYEAYYSWGETTIDQAAKGNVNVQKVQQLLEAPDGGASLCAGGFNPFGIQPISQACVDFVDETGITKTVFTQKVAQGFVTGELAQLPGGPLSVVVGAESRKFRYSFDPGALFGPIAGFNTATPDLGTNSFLDFFGELSAPVTDTLEFGATVRHSKSDFNDIENGVDGRPSKDFAYGGTVIWKPIPEIRLRGSYQHSVRAPNFGELFSGGGSFPQIFDPCSVGTNFRTTGGANATALCAATGVGATSTFAATPGAQLFLTTTGNPNLKPEKSDAFTAGMAFNKWGFTGSIDYYNIRIKDSIFSADPNDILASCYGYNAVNPLSATSGASPYCAGLIRQGDQLAGIALPASLGGDADGYFQAVNLGKVKTSGIDVQLGYRMPVEFIQDDAALRFDLMLNYLIDFKTQGLGGGTTDFAGTASYFGAGLGTSFPEWKGTMNVALDVKPISLISRIRYIDGMENRASRQFIGETFTGPKSVWYFDFAVEANVEALTFRVGVNNAFNKQPPQYAPNVQSGTDPSTYDVIGRRGYVSARVRF